jgi:hypothetical protein
MEDTKRVPEDFATAGGSLAGLARKPLGPKHLQAATAAYLKDDLATLMRKSEALIKAMTTPK